VEIDFIRRTLRTTGLLALLALVFGSLYFGFSPALSIFTGIIWGMVNLYFLSMLIRSTLRPEGADKMTALILLIIKFPLLYLSGYLMMVSNYFNPLLLVIGFTVNLLVIVLKAAGRALLKLDYLEERPKKESLKGV
jgi:O-antigen/teichoic acid export membrane protein